MKTNTFNLFSLLALLILVSSCTESADSVFTSPDEEIILENYSYMEPVRPDDVNLLSQVLRLPETSSRALGAPPAPSNNENAPVLEVTNDNFMSSNGSTLYLPINFDASADLAGVYVQVAGANQYFDINANPSNNNYFTIPIGLPTNVLNGEFEIVYCVYDVNGLISQIIRRTVIVELLGTGSLQINLTWDTATDVDLHVIDPSGVEIYYGDFASATGGILDRDDVDGFGPENIFWQDDAPQGEYRVLVNDYTGVFNGEVNYTVTISTVTGDRKTFSNSISSGNKIEVAAFNKIGGNIVF